MYKKKKRKISRQPTSRPEILPQPPRLPCRSAGALTERRVLQRAPRLLTYPASDLPCKRSGAYDCPSTSHRPSCLCLPTLPVIYPASDPGACDRTSTLQAGSRSIAWPTLQAPSPLRLGSFETISSTAPRLPRPPTRPLAYPATWQPASWAAAPGLPASPEAEGAAMAPKAAPPPVCRACSGRSPRRGRHRRTFPQAPLPGHSPTLTLTLPPTNPRRRIANISIALHASHHTRQCILLESPQHGATLPSATLDPHHLAANRLPLYTHRPHFGYNSACNGCWHFPTNARFGCRICTYPASKHENFDSRSKLSRGRRISYPVNTTLPYFQPTL